MNLQNSPIAKLFIKTWLRLGLFIFVSFAHVSVKAWEVDLSRRSQDLRKLSSTSGPTMLEPQGATETKNLFDSVLTSVEPAQEVVVLNTEKGFVPDTLNLRAGQSYKIHVVNVNEKEKNASFILDAFAEHHGTFYGQPKSFEINPKMEGIFSFQCPETAKQGRIVVTPSANSRKPASN